MQLRKLLLSIHGVSLTELMVGLGLLGGISLISMKAMQEQAGNESYLKWTAAVNRAAMEIQNTMNTAARCNEIFVGETRESTSWPNISSTARFCGKPDTSSACTYALRIKTGTGTYQELLKADTEYGEGFYIPPYGIQLATSANGSSISELVLTFKTRNRTLRKNSASIKGTTATDQGTIIKRIPFVTTLSGNMIKSCGPVVADEDLKAKEIMCRSLGGAATWSAGTGTCTLNEVKCPTGQVPTQMTSLGSFTCTSVNNAAMRDQLFDFSSTTCPGGQGVTLTVGATGKIKAGCTATSSGCVGSTMVWYGSGASGTQCSAAVGAGTAGQSTSVSSSAAGTSGSASLSCDAVQKAWIITGTPSCSNTTLNCPAGQAVYWSGATKFCSGTSVSGITGAKATITDSVNAGGTDGTGSTTAECVAGKWSVIGTPSCN